MMKPFCRGGQIRTDDLLVPNQARYRATLHPELFSSREGMKRFRTSNYFCDPAGNRTPNRQIRNLMLYPVELPDLNFKPRSLAGFMAERGGFEPPVRFDPYDSLANCWFKPLTHLSVA